MLVDFSMSLALIIWSLLGNLNGISSEQVEYERVGPVFVPQSFVDAAKVTGPVSNAAQCGVQCSDWHWLQCNAYEILGHDKICHLYLLFNEEKELVHDRMGSYVYIRKNEGAFQFPRKVLEVKKYPGHAVPRLWGWNGSPCKDFPEVPGQVSSHHGFLVMDGNKIFAAGGDALTGSKRYTTRNTWILDLNRQPLYWERKADLPRKRCYGRVVQFERRVYYFGGMEAVGKKLTKINNVDYFDIDENMWVDTRKKTKGWGYMRLAANIPGTSWCIIFFLQHYMEIFDLKASRLVKSVAYKKHPVLKYQPAFAIPTLLNDGRNGVVFKAIHKDLPLQFMDYADPKMTFKKLNDRVLPKGKMFPIFFDFGGAIVLDSKKVGHFWDKRKDEFVETGLKPKNAATQKGYDDIICD